MNIRYVFSTLLVVLLCSSAFSQLYTFRLILSSTTGSIEGIGSEIYVGDQKVASLLSDSLGILKVKLEVKSGTEITMIILPGEHKRYLLDLNELNKDHSHYLKLEAMTESDKRAMVDAGNGLRRLNDDFATIFLKYDKYREGVVVVESEKFNAKRKFKLAPIMALAALQTADKAINAAEQSRQVFRDRERAYNADQLRQKEEEKRRENWNEKKEEEKQEAKEKEESEELKADRAKWKKKLDKYESKLDKLEDKRKDLNDDQKKLDKKVRKGKIDSGDAQEWQRKINKRKKDLEKQMKELEKKIKAHKKQEPK